MKSCYMLPPLKLKSLNQRTSSEDTSEFSLLRASRKSLSLSLSVHECLRERTGGDEYWARIWTRILIYLCLVGCGRVSNGYNSV